LFYNGFLQGTDGADGGQAGGNRDGKFCVSATRRGRPWTVHGPATARRLPAVRPTSTSPHPVTPGAYGLICTMLAVDR
jgi:hypothetical protein